MFLSMASEEGLDAPGSSQSVELLPFQWLLFESQKPYIALSGGVGSGKTMLLVRKHHSVAVRWPMMTSWFCSHTLSQVREVCLDEYLKFLTLIGWRENVHYTLNRSELKLTYAPNGHIIYFKSAVAYERWKGASLIYASGDEPGFWPKGAFRELDYRLRGEGGDDVLRQICLGGTPQGLTWYMEQFDEASLKPCGPYLQNGENKIPLGRENETKFVLHYPTFLNRHVGERYLTRILDSYGHNRELIRSHMLGEFCPLFENRVYNFSKANIVDVPAKPDHPSIGLSFDFNVGRMAWTGWQRYGDGDYCVAEAKSGTVNTLAACEQIVEAFPPLLYSPREIDITGGHDGHQGDTRGETTDYDIIYRELKQAYPESRITIHAERHAKSIRSTVLATDRAICGNPATGRPRQLFVSSLCSNTINGLYKTVYADGGTQIKKTGSSKDAPTDFSDSVRYRANFSFPHEEPYKYQGLVM